MSKTVKEHWNPVVEVIHNSAAGDIYAVLEDRVQDVPVEKQVVADEDGLPVETGRYDTRPVQSQFWLVLRSGEEQAEAYMGTVKRQLDGRDNFVGYSSSVMAQLLHQTGLRLEEIEELGRDVYFTGAVFRLKHEKVSKSLTRRLLQSDDRELDLVRD